MREIKFRVWDAEYKEMLSDGTDGIFMSQNGSLIMVQGVFRHTVSKVDGCTVLFYTGVDDNAGKPIYEGDLVSFTRVFERERKIATLISCVEFENGEFGFRMRGFNDRFMSLGVDSDVTVVGNKFENEDLLGKPPYLENC